MILERGVDQIILNVFLCVKTLKLKLGLHSFSLDSITSLNGNIYQTKCCHHWNI